MDEKPIDFLGGQVWDAAMKLFLLMTCTLLVLAPAVWAEDDPYSSATPGKAYEPSASDDDSRKQGDDDDASVNSMNAPSGDHNAGAGHDSHGGSGYGSGHSGGGGHR
jgi:hypothetical protein